MPKAPTARTLFIERMKREGKYEEWRRRYKEAKKDVTPIVHVDWVACYQAEHIAN